MRRESLSTKSVTRAVLEKISEAGEVSLDIFFPPNYSYTRISRHLFGLDKYPKVAPPTLSAILSRLKKQGLIERKGSRKSSVWFLSKNGKKRLIRQKLMDKRKTPPDGIPRLVLFDIPEEERNKRRFYGQSL